MLQSVSLKIKTKLTYGIGLLFAMIVLLGSLSVKNIYRMSADTQNILADNYNTLLYSRRMLDALERIKTDPVARTEFEKNLNLQKENITEVDENAATTHLVTQYESMKKDMNDLKRLVYDLMQNEPQQETGTTEPTTSLVLRNLYDHEPGQFTPSPSPTLLNHREDHIQDTEAVIEESFSIEEKEKELITKALEKNHGKRKLAAKDLGISERTLYRKLKEYNLEN